MHSLHVGNNTELQNVARKYINFYETSINSLSNQISKFPSGSDATKTISWIEQEIYENKLNVSIDAVDTVYKWYWEKND